MAITQQGDARRKGGGTAKEPGAKPGQRANAADRHVGARIRERRVMMGLSQQQLARMVGVTYQQAHKYERGLNRISAGRLFEIAQVLDVPVSFFFEGLAATSDHQEALSQMARALAAQSQAASGGGTDTH